MLKYWNSFSSNLRYYKGFASVSKFLGGIPKFFALTCPFRASVKNIFWKWRGVQITLGPCWPALYRQKTMRHSSKYHAVIQVCITQGWGNKYWFFGGVICLFNLHPSVWTFGTEITASTNQSQAVVLGLPKVQLNGIIESELDLSAEDYSILDQKRTSFLLFGVDIPGIL